MESVEKELPSGRQIKCDVCDVWCSGNISYQSHIQGRAHYVNLQKKDQTDVGYGTDGPPAAKRAKKSGSLLEERKCELCNISILGKEQFEFHLKGARHLRKLNEKEAGYDVESPHIVESPGKGFRCTMCNVEMSGKLVVVSHLKGGKHLKNLKLSTSTPPHANNGDSKKTNEPYECKICRKFVNSPAVLALHEDSPKHKAKAAMASKESAEQEADARMIRKSYDSWDPQG